MRTEISWQEHQTEVIACHKCARLVEWREEVARVRRRAYQDEEYWGKPVPGFGDRNGRVLIVGLAPGAHGANRTGRMFTGDSSGNFLFDALFKAGFANQSSAISRTDGLELCDVFISAVCRCVPPGNKPRSDEIANCLPYLQRDIQLMENLEGIVALGRIAFDDIIALYRQNGYEIPRLKFKRNAFYEPGKDLPWLLASYHPSRQNTQTGRLSAEMFAQVWSTVRSLLES
jgi:uracil-DNA glycosylase family 4